jgi:transposase InsO family protein
VAAITQTHLEPVLRDILDQFPFPIRGFHSDNGSEFINDTVSGLLKELLIEQTKSRPRRSNDNGLVESKNVIRKHMGYGYIAAAHAPDIHSFYQQWFNPYLNFHRPCGQPERIMNEKGKEKYVYRRYATPWEILRELTLALPQNQSYLKPTRSIASLDQTADAYSDTESAHRMQKAKRKLFTRFQPKQVKRKSA